MGGRVNITVHVEPIDGVPAPVEYRWDTDTAILTARLANGASAAGGRTGASGAVELAGNDGSWLILDVKEGSVQGVEVAVWPDVKKIPALRAPLDPERGRLVLPSAGEKPGVAVLQMDTTLIAEADQTERTIHFRLGAARPTRTVRIARDILVDVEDDAITGIWLLNVPPFPSDE
jgi:hypothetical protein